MALTDSLISYWKLDEASGDAVDSHGSNTLPDQNTVGSATGKINNCRDFESSSAERFYKAANSSLDTGDIDFTISCWFKPETVTGNYFTIASKDNILVSREWILVIDMDAANKVAFGVFNGTTAVGIAQWGTAPSVGTWYHVVAWHDAGNNQIGIAINAGTPVVNATTGAPGVSGAGLAIGSGNVSSAPAIYFDGLIDEFGFWKRVLTSDERTALYNGGAGLAYPFSTSYTLTAGSGSFTLTWQAAGLRASRVLTAGQGSYALTGQSAGLLASRRLTAAAGSYALSGQDAGLVAARNLTAAQGSFTLAGQDAGLLIAKSMAAGPGSYVLTGQDAGLLAARMLTADYGAYTLTGQSADLLAPSQPQVPPVTVPLVTPPQVRTGAGQNISNIGWYSEKPWIRTRDKLMGKDMRSIAEEITKGHEHSGHSERTRRSRAEAIAVALLLLKE